MDPFELLYHGEAYTCHSGFTDVKQKAKKAWDDTDAYQFVPINPIKPGHTKMPCSEGNEAAPSHGNVSAFWNWVLEFDDLPKAKVAEANSKRVDQINNIISLQVSSGNKSIHNWICCDEDVGYEQWLRIALALQKIYPDADEHVLLQPYYYVRCPDGTRSPSKARQRVLLNTGTRCNQKQIIELLEHFGAWDPDIDITTKPTKHASCDAGEFEEQHPKAFAVRQWLKGKLGWNSDRRAATFRGGDNPTALHDLVTCVYDHVEGISYGWFDLVQQFSEADELTTDDMTEYYELLDDLDIEFEEKLSESLKERKQQVKATWAEIEKAQEKAIGERGKAVVEHLKHTGTMQQDGKGSWDDVSNDDVLKAINGTGLGEIDSVLRSTMWNPNTRVHNRPLEITLPQALALVSAVMCTEKDMATDNEFGYSRAKLSVSSGACNGYYLAFADSTDGKNAGELLNKAGLEEGLLVSGGSAEGIMAEFEKVPNGILYIDEMQPYMDPTNWRHNVLPVMTENFSRGYYKDNRAKTANTIFIRGFFPTIAANAQPDIIKHFASIKDIQTGFYGRCLMTLVTGDECRRFNNRHFGVSGILQNLQKYKHARGNVVLPDLPFNNLFMEVHNNIPKSLRSGPKRIVEQYGLKFATMLAVDIIGCNKQPFDLSGKKNKAAVLEVWKRAATLSRWFIRQSLDILGLIGLGDSATKSEVATRIQNIIKSRVRHLVMSGTTPTRRNILNSREIKDNSGIFTTQVIDAAFEALVDLSDLEVVKKGKTCVYLPK